MGVCALSVLSSFYLVLPSVLDVATITLTKSVTTVAVNINFRYTIGYQNSVQLISSFFAWTTVKLCI